MNPLAQRKKKKKKKKERKISGVLFFIMENRICAMVASFGLWWGFFVVPSFHVFGVYPTTSRCMRRWGECTSCSVLIMFCPKRGKKFINITSHHEEVCSVVTLRRTGSLDGSQSVSRKDKG